MLGRLLEDLGLFAGTRKDDNNEAIFFQDINTWLLSQCGGHWDHPKPIDHLWNNAELQPLVEKYIRNLIDSPRSLQFLGPRLYAAGGISALKTWGWKDPRNTFTLPMWLRIFPDAKVICIERHGVDVAQSLRVRDVKQLANATRHYDKYRSVFFLRPKGGGFVASPRCTSLDGGFSLWKEYVDRASAVMASLSADRKLMLRYEDVLENPVEHLRTSAAFCGLDASDARLREVIAGINFDRARSYLSNPELRRFAADHQAELNERGYSDQVEQVNIPTGA
jgi:Sulfotransferase family